MLKDITLGQYFPGNSFIHRLDPRVKIVLVVFLVVLIFFAKNIYSFAFLFLGVLLLVLLSKISLKVVFKGIRPVLFLMLFTAVINIFWARGDGAPLFEFGFIKVWESGLVNALFIVLRIVSLVTATSLLLTYTTSPIALTDALEKLLKPLKKLHVPVHEFAMMMTIALRFIPILIEETDKIMSAQRARGADFDSGNLLQKAKALIPLLVPLFISAFRRADELATAMECRCYQGGEGRTKLKQLHYTSLDFIAYAVGAVLVLGVLLLNRIG